MRHYGAVILSREPVEIATSDELSRWVDATVADLFAWLCRIVGSARAEEVLPEVYRTIGASARSGADRIDMLGTCAVACRLVIAHDAPGAGAGASTVMERAVVDLRVVRGGSDADIVAITGCLEQDVDSMLASAEQMWRTMQPASTVDDWLRGRETWLDDLLREACRKAALGDRGEPLDRTAGRRQAGGGRGFVAAMMVAVAAIVGVVAWRTTDRSQQTSAAATFGTALSGNRTSHEFDPTHPFPVQRPGYVLPMSDVSALVASATERPAANEAIAEPVGWFEVWAEPTATHFASRWFAAVTSRCAQSGQLLQDATRMTIGDRHALLIVGQLGELTIEVAPGDDSLTSRSLELVGHGFTSAELVQLAGSLQLDLELSSPDAPPPPNCGKTGVPDGMQFDASSAGEFAHLERVVSRPAFGGSVLDQLAARTSRTTTYGGRDGGGAGVTVEARDADPDLVRLQQILLVSPLDPAAPISPVRAATVGDRVMTVSAMPGEEGDHSAQITFTTDVDSVTVSTSNTTTFPLEQLIALAGAARPATPEQWYDLSGERHTPPQPVITTVVPGTEPPLQFQPESIEFATADGDMWNVFVVGRTILDVSSRGVGGGIARGPLTVDADTTVLQWESPSETVLLIALTDPGTGHSVRLTVGDDVRSAVPLVMVPDAAMSLAIVTFTDLAPYHLDLLDELGTPVRVLSP
ncbi:MAG: hypothetical protein JWN62_1392 [Acidimicrobiales bacterium]|nr:hypothetical protein [Acidimicrobiales bacterium]